MGLRKVQTSEWITVCTLGWLVGWLVNLTLYSGPSAVLVVGCAIGIGQWLVLQRSGHASVSWLIVTAMTWTTGAAITAALADSAGLSLAAVQSAAAMMAAADVAVGAFLLSMVSQGALVGVGQALLLGQRNGRMLAWVGANAGGMLLGTIASVIVSPAMAGLMYGITTASQLDRVFPTVEDGIGDAPALRAPLGRSVAGLTAVAAGVSLWQASWLAGLLLVCSGILIWGWSAVAEDSGARVSRNADGPRTGGDAGELHATTANSAADGDAR